MECKALRPRRYTYNARKIIQNHLALNMLNISILRYIMYIYDKIFIINLMITYDNMRTYTMISYNDHIQYDSI